MTMTNKALTFLIALALLSCTFASCSDSTGVSPDNDLDEYEEVTNDDFNSLVNSDDIRREEDYTSGTESIIINPITTESIEDDPEETEETEDPDETEESTEEEDDEAVEVGGVIDGIMYIDGTLIVNKTYSLPSDYNPGVDATAKKAFDKMAANAYSNDGVSLYIISDFRSYSYQVSLYQRYVNQSGQEEADRYSARAGHSEHQTGLAFDLNSLDQSFGETKAGKWLEEHCHEYGFIIRYPKDKEEQTGYMYEPWHVRYLGVELATEIYESGLCLEEYFGITSEYSD